MLSEINTIWAYLERIVMKIEKEKGIRWNVRTKWQFLPGFLIWMNLMHRINGTDLSEDVNIVLYLALSSLFSKKSCPGTAIFYTIFQAMWTDILTSQLQGAFFIPYSYKILNRPTVCFFFFTDDYTNSSPIVNIDMNFSFIKQ